jgi:glucose/arabinose dehydrogenase
MTSTSATTTVARDDLELICDGLTFPNSLTFDVQGNAFIGESGVPFYDGAPSAAVLRIAMDGSREYVAQDLGRPLNGTTWFDGGLFISVGDDPGQIICIAEDGARTTIVNNLPGPGNYHINMVAFGPDGKLYFSQGAMSNLGIVGLDAYELGWLMRLPHAHDVPGLDIELAGFNAETEDPFGEEGSTVATGAFCNFGEVAKPGTRVKGSIPCSSAVMRCNPDGSDLELVAWGIRNAYGLGFLPDGRLIATDQSSDDRGSRAIGNVPELLFEVKQGCWYGWPDFVGGRPVTDKRFKASRGGPLEFVLANHDELPTPERGLLEFPSHSSAVKFDVAPDSCGAMAGQMFVALFGDERPMTAPVGPRAGRAVVRVDPSDWSIHELFDGPRHRPIDLRFHPTTGDLYILDFGDFEMTEDNEILSEPRSGSLWRIASDRLVALAV